MEELSGSGSVTPFGIMSSEIFQLYEPISLRVFILVNVSGRLITIVEKNPFPSLTSM